MYQNNEQASSSTMNTKFQSKNKNYNYNKPINQINQLQPPRTINQAPYRANPSAQTKTGYPNMNKFNTGYPKIDSPEKKGNTNNTTSSSRFTP